MRVVVIGGDAVGMTAASQIKRSLGDDVDVIVIQEQQWTSYSACGIPYWIAGETTGPDTLVARSPEQHREHGIDVRTGMLASAIDPDTGSVTMQPVTGGPATRLGYDHLVIGTGSRPRTPPVDGLDLPGVYRVQTLDEGQAAIDGLARDPRTAVVLGAGYIGIEMAEAGVQRGLATTVVDLAPEPMVSLDADMGCLVRAGMTERGVDMRMGEPVRELLAGADGRVRAVVTDAGEIPADIVFLGLGVTPRTELAAAAGLPLGEHGGLLTDDHQRVRGYGNIWAGGDCVEVTDRLTGAERYLPLGTHANKHGRVIGVNIAGGDLAFPGVIGTAITKFCDLEVSRTGLKEDEQDGLVSVLIHAQTSVGYMPDSAVMAVKMIAERTTGRLMGTQIVGGRGAAMRIDTAATAIWTGMTAPELVQLDLAYSPPFSPVWDPVQVAARVLLGKLSD